MKIEVFVTLKDGVFDPQGKAIENSLENLGFSGVSRLTQGKYIRFELDEKDKEKAKEKAKLMCEKLLANVVIEKYRIEVE